jgi:hypothetical protein
VNGNGVDVEGFNPNKTFGAEERSKIGIFVGELDNGKNGQRED